MRTPLAVTVTLADWANQQQPTNPADLTTGSTNHSDRVSESSPTLEETFVWMLDFVKRYRKVSGTPSTTQYADFFERVQGCDVKISHFMFVGQTTSPSGSFDTFRLRDIDQEHIYVSNSADVNLFTIRNEPLIHRTGLLTGRPEGISMSYVSFNSREDAERFAKAIKHAVTLCASVKEPF